MMAREKTGSRSVRIQNEEILALNEEILAWDEEIKHLRKLLRKKDIAMMELMEEQDQFRNAFAQQALTGMRQASVALKNESSLQGSVALENGSGSKSAKDKLAANTDYYPTPALRMTYVKSRIGGRAADHTIARSREDAINPYTNAADIFNHLKMIFLDVNCVLTAKANLQHLYMEDGDRFQDLLSDFTYLTQEGGMAETEWKEELYLWMTAEMQCLVIRESNDDAIPFMEFTTVCTRTANHLEQIAFNENKDEDEIDPLPPDEDPEITEIRRDDDLPSG